MSSSPSAGQHLDRSRPARDSTVDGGTRTPRRVQWAGGIDDRHETSSLQSVHELDEWGLDPSAFKSLRDALEKHQSEEHLRNERDGLPSVPPPAVVPFRVTTSTAVAHPNPFMSTSVALSDTPYHTGASTERTSETRGTASTHSSPITEELSPRFSSSTLVAHRTHDVPGEAWIDPSEREGLPLHTPIPNFGSRNPLRRRSTWKPERRDDYPRLREDHIERLAEHHAAGVVRAHTRRGWGWLRSPKGKSASKSKEKREGKENEARDADDKGKATRRSQQRARHTNSNMENDTDFTNTDLHRPGRTRKGLPGSWLGVAMHTHQGRQRPESHHSQSPRLGNGVLSALLTLYNQDHDDDRSISGESTTSSDAEHDDLLQPHRPWLPDQGDNHDHPNSRGQRGGKDRRASKFNLGSPSIFSHFRHPSTPTTHTTAALIAGAGTLSGAAAPQQATLAPNLERPGYSLVRYSVDEVPKVASTTPKIGALRGLRRVHSTDSGIHGTVAPVCGERQNDAESPPTPAATIVASPTGGSEGATLKQERHRHSASVPGERRGWTGRLRDLPMHFSPSHFRPLTPHPFTPKGKGLDTPHESDTETPRTTSAEGTPVDDFGDGEGYFDPKRAERDALLIAERERKGKAKRRKKERERKRRKAEVYITRHVAEILQRQEFILKLARAMMMFGAPSHRLASQIQSTGRVLDLELSCMYLPDVMLISFEDRATGTSNVKFIRQGSALDLEKLGDAHALYWNVIHDNMSVSGASALLDVLMRKKPLYNYFHLTLIGAMCSASICSVSFSGSFIDCLVSAPLGGLLVTIQLVGGRNELYANVFEITIATLLSFVSAALASSKRFCYSAVASSSVVLILPGFIVLSGSLELSSRSLVAGAVRLCFAVMYSLFLGFGLAIGAELYQKLSGKRVVGPTDYMCLDSHDPSGPWWQQTPSLWWAFLTVPMYSLFLSMRLMAPWWRREMIISIAIASIGWVTNHFVGTKFPTQSDISAAVGAFAVGFVSNIYGRFFDGNAFIVMITGILFQVPSGLGNGGLLNFVSDQTSGSSSTYVSGFQTALQLISVAVGLTVGLGISLVVVHPVQSRRRAGGLFSL